MRGLSGVLCGWLGTPAQRSAEVPKPVGKQCPHRTSHLPCSLPPSLHSLSLWGHSISIPQTGPGPGFQGTRAAHSTVSAAADRLIGDVASLTGATQLCLLSVPWRARKFSPDASVWPQPTMSPVRSPPVLRCPPSSGATVVLHSMHSGSTCHSAPRSTRVIKNTIWTPALTKSLKANPSPSATNSSAYGSKPQILWFTENSHVLLSPPSPHGLLLAREPSAGLTAQTSSCGLLQTTTHCLPRQRTRGVSSLILQGFPCNFIFLLSPSETSQFFLHILRF